MRKEGVFVLFVVSVFCAHIRCPFFLSFQIRPCVSCTLITVTLSLFLVWYKRDRVFIVLMCVCVCV